MKIVTLLIVSLCVSSSIKAKGIELEPRIGCSVSDYYNYGMFLGSMASFRLIDQLYVQPGILLNISKPGGAKEVFIPVYASYRIPVYKTTIRLNVGPYMKFCNHTNAGASAEGGAEYRNFYAGVAYTQDLSWLARMEFCLSVGYKFKL